MDISQSDRDKLRNAQRNLNPQIVIGNIVEHKVQDPKAYRNLSNQDQGSSTQPNQLPQIQYQSKYLNTGPDISLLTSIMEDQENELPITAKDVQANMWLNMNQVEFDKLEWMSDKADKVHQERFKGSTLFDINGRVVQKKDSLKDEECHDVESLVQLLDSVYQPQVTYALKIITKIASLSTMGYYDGAFDENIHGILIKNCLLRVRHHLDSPNESTCQSALVCLRSLVCNTMVDEVILDRIYPLISENRDSNLWLHPKGTNSKEFTIEMKDVECVEIDVILALIQRTEILTRFSYLLREKAGAFVATYRECILDILIRIARHSPEVCHDLIQDGLVSSVIDIFLSKPLDTESQLATKALKLVRIVIQAVNEFEFRRIKFSNNEIMDSKILTCLLPVIESYFFIDCFGLPRKSFDKLSRIHIEALRIMKALATQKRFRGAILGVVAMGQDKLFKNFKTFTSFDATKQPDSKISLDWQLAAHLIDMIGYLLKYDKKRSESNSDTLWWSYVKPAVLQWLTDIIRMKVIPHLDVSIAIATAVNHYSTHANDQARGLLTEVMIESIVEDNIKRKGRGYDFFRVLARSASESSQLMNFLEENGCMRDPVGLPSFGHLNFNTSIQHTFKLSPLYDSDSPYILLNTIIRHLQDRSIGCLGNLKIFVDTLAMTRYIRSTVGYNKLPATYESLVQQSLTAQFEIQIICRSLLLLGRYYLEDVQENQDPQFATDLESQELEQSRVECYSNLCYYTISVIALIHTESPEILKLKDELLEHVLFNSKLQTRVFKENFKLLSSLERITYGHLDPTDCRVDSQQIPESFLRVLIPVYMSCEHPNRFWIFQPLIKYCISQIINVDEPKRTDNLWLKNNMNWRLHTGESVSCEDSDVITVILSFNATMMQYSSSYNQLIVRPNLEDYLCLVGSVFLHDDLFLNEHISRQVSLNLRILLNETIEKSGGKFNVPFQDASRTIGPLNLTLADFFNKLVDQFEGVSYGDLAFANFLVLFLTPKSDKIFRKKLFQEKTETCIRQLRLGVDSLWAPSEMFFKTQEKDAEIRAIIARSSPYILEGSFLQYYRDFHTQT